MARKASARHILVKTQEACEDLKTKIGAGSDFAELAKKHSQCPSGREGGDLGSFGPGQMVPEFDKVVFSAAGGHRAGAHQDPVRLAPGRSHQPHRLSRAPIGDGISFPGRDHEYVEHRTRDRCKSIDCAGVPRARAARCRWPFCSAARR